MNKEKSFAGFPVCDEVGELDTSIALIGAPFGTPYDSTKPPHSQGAPMAIRRESNRYSEDPIAWDFDLDGKLVDICAGRVVDCGDLPGSQEDALKNRDQIQEAIRNILNAGAVPVVLGGDDSIPIPVLRAYEGREPFTVLQLDAHIDWRDSVDGVRDGYSSTMRRASELPWVNEIVQVGARGVGSARRIEHQAALDYGAKLITARQFHQEGIDSVLDHLPIGGRCFITVDLDVLDPSIMPAVGAPTPGGVYFQETIDLIHTVCTRTRVGGVCLVELVPELDVNHLGTITAMRVVWNLVGALGKQLNL